MKESNKTPAPSWQEQRAESLLDGSNSDYLEMLYEQYLEDPEQLEDRWRSYFSSLPRVNGHSTEAFHSSFRKRFKRFKPNLGQHTEAAATTEHDQQQVRVLQLINAYRFLGHQRAKTNPLGDYLEQDVPELSLEHHELQNIDPATIFKTGSLIGPDELPLGKIIEQLEETYCGSIGAEYMHITSTEEKRWLQRQIESVNASPEYSPSQRRYLLERVTAAETLERYLHSKYVGQKRFSLEGGESLIPLLDDLIQSAGAAGVKEVVIGMAHRGRLNVLINILGKSPAMLFQEFESGVESEGTGDVKYHLGYSSDMNTPGGVIHVAMAFNPSHLEIVGPVVNGAVRARQDRWGDSPGKRAMPIVIHGDAAFAGQGVVMEQLNMSNTRGFKNRGTVHIVVNNQIGFTTSFARDARSTLYCTDVVKMVNAPILHVNGDDPEAVVFASQVALDYRMRFEKDVVIDLMCYRRHGHNEADEPSATQPIMYQKIKSLPTTRQFYTRELIEQGVLTETKAEEIRSLSKARLEKGDPVVPHLIELDRFLGPKPVDWNRYLQGKEWDDHVDTRISADSFADLGKRLNNYPEDLKLHPRVAKIVNARLAMAAGEQNIDWGFGELLAYASLVESGFAVRLTGQDAGRGTFFHRHAVLHDQSRQRAYTPLKYMSDDQSEFVVIDSLLSEEAVLAFEYGYSTTEPRSLVIWEAQFGDFANGAQVVMDQFISSGEQKWGRLCGLVMFLPHGYEGQGPEHSSARLERYLQLCAQHNMQICIPTTPAQTFHMLRRQMLRDYRKPLVVMTPKSLLRHPLAVNTREDFTERGFQNVIAEIDPLEAEKVDRVVLCSGKVYFDLLEARRVNKLDNVAIVRIEQLYPFPDDEFCAAVSIYKNVKKYIWCQEEPLNQGAWYNQQHHLYRLLGNKAPLEEVTRPASASPAVGSLGIHREQQQLIITTALGLDQ